MLKIYGITVLHVNGFNIRSTKVERMLGKCWTNVQQSFQTASTPSNIFKNKANAVWMLYESLNRFKFDSTRLQQAFNIFYAFNNVGRHCFLGFTKKIG